MQSRGAFRLLGRLPQSRRPVLSAKTRLLSTVPPPAASSSSRTLLLVGLAAAASGALGYSFARPRPSSLASPSSTVSQAPTKLEAAQYGTSEDFAKALDELQQRLTKDQISTDSDVLEDHGSSNHHHHHGQPFRAIVYPKSTEEVVHIVNVSRKYKLPIVPYGGGTSLEGQSSGNPAPCICIDMADMSSILEVHAEDSDLVCQAGVSWESVNEHLKDLGLPLFFPLDPGPSASLGGMMSTGCSGTNAVRYGTARGEWFLNATVVLPSGEVIKTRRRSRKSSAGFDTTKLFIGAEGTLGIITEITIRLAPLLPTNVAIAQFPNVRAATEAVREILNTGAPIQCVELCDDQFMKATNIHGTAALKYPEVDSLYFKFQGPPETIENTTNIVRDIIKKHGSTGFQVAQDEDEARSLWADRKNALFSSLALVPGSKGWSTDVCVPVSRLPELVYETKKDIADNGLVSTVVGHVGDGNFHALILFSDDEQFAKTTEVVHRMVHRAIALDGTCSGEHGVGWGKREYLVEELGEGTVRLMRTVKQAIDPLNLMNPGKLYPEVPERKE